MKNFIILFISIFLITILNAEYVSTKTVAIPPFNSLTDNNHYKWLSEAISDMLITDIAAPKKIRVVNRAELKKIISLQKYNMSDIVDDNQISKLGNMLGASILIDGSFSILNNTIRIDAKIFDVEKGLTIGAASVNGNVENLFLLEKQLSQKIFETLNINLSTDDEIALFQIDTNNIVAVENNYKGVIELENKNYDKAKEYFTKAQKEDPYYKQAKLNIDKTQKEVNGKSLFASALNEIDAKKKQKEDLENIIKEFVNSCFDISIKGKPELITHPENKEMVDLKLEVSVQDNKVSIKRFINNLKKISKGKSVLKIRGGEYLPYEKYIEINLFEESKEYYWKNPYMNNRRDYYAKKWKKTKFITIKSQGNIIYKKQIQLYKSLYFLSSNIVIKSRNVDIEKKDSNNFSIVLKNISIEQLKKIDKIEIVDE